MQASGRVDKIQSTRKNHRQYDEFETKSNQWKRRKNFRSKREQRMSFWDEI